MQLNGHRVKHGLDYFLDRFLDYLFGPFFFGIIFRTIFLDHFIRRGGGEAHHWYSGKCGMQSISAEGGVGARVLLLREG